MLDSENWQHRCVKATFTLCFGVAVKYARSSLSNFLNLFIENLIF